MAKMTKEQVEEWARKADRGVIHQFLVETVYKLDALEGSAQFTDEGEAEASDGLKDAAEMLRGVLEKEFATRVTQ